MNKAPIVLVILDGFGYRKDPAYNAISHAISHNLAPYLKHMFQAYPYVFLKASGAAVGLPDGYIGNSEVGHLTIGAGRIIKQPITILNELIDANTLKDLPALQNLASYNGRLHIMGLLSDAGIHSHTKYLYALIKIAAEQNISHIYIHAFLDGRDTPPRSAEIYLTELEAQIKEVNFQAHRSMSSNKSSETSNTSIALGSLHGRFYAIDRDTNWERTLRSYEVLTGHTKTKNLSWQEILKTSYSHNITDEFLEPVLVSQDSAIHDGDTVISFNIRPDRIRQLTRCFLDPKSITLNTPELSKLFMLPLEQIKLANYITPVSYGDFHGSISMLKKQIISHTLKEELSKKNKRIFSIAETEKYAHVTYFFGGGQEEPFPGETQVLIPSKKVKSFADCPEMSAPEITKQVLESISNDMHDFYLINYANADMVGHSGNFEATVLAIACLDKQLAQLHEKIVTECNGTLYITADHGKAEDMFDLESNQPRTAHTANLVPFIEVRRSKSNNTLESQKLLLNFEQLADIAPYILDTMGIEIPKEMIK